MARVHFTQNLQRHVISPPRNVGGVTVRETLDNVFADNPQFAATSSMNRANCGSTCSSSSMECKSATAWV